MKKVLIMMIQGKGGCGKSSLSTFLGDALKSIGVNIKFYDNDSETPKLSRFKALDSEHIQLFEKNKNGNIIAESLDLNKLDVVSFEIENGDSNIIYLDNGSPSYQPIQGYFSRDFFDETSDIITPVLIVPITKDVVTHSSPTELLNSYGNTVNYILIINNYLGEFEFDLDNFKKSGVNYQVIKFEKLTKTQDDNLSKALNSGLLLSEAINSPDFNIVAKSRLKKIKNDFETQAIDVISGFLS